MNGKQKNLILDMHAHPAALEAAYAETHTCEEQLEYGIHELMIRRSQDTAAFFSCGNLQEWEFVETLFRNASGQYGDSRVSEDNACGICGKETGKTVNAGTKWGYRSFGIHPWYSDRYRAEAIDSDAEPDTETGTAYRNCDAVGEIGMDSVWCDIPLAVQKELFVRQLRIAEQLEKPVILHTKGQEKEIVQLIRGFRGKVCVHWYSGDIETLKEYIALDCYFTLGPDVRKVLGQQSEQGSQNRQDRASAQLYRYMLTHIPPERLFIETDGLSAVEWALGEGALSAAQIPGILRENLRFVSEQINVAEEALCIRMQKNLNEFLFCEEK